MTITLGYIAVQPDWQVDVKNALNGVEATHKFWVSAYKHGQTSIHDTITVTQSSDESSNTFVSLNNEKQDEITAEYLSPRHLRLSSSKLGAPPTTYSAPRTTMHCSQITRGTGVQSFDISPYGGLAVVCGDDGKMSVYETESGAKRVELDGHLGDVTCCQFFPSGQVVLSGATDMRLRIWSASDGSNPVTLVGHRAAVTDTEIVGVGKNVLSCGKDGTVRLWHCGSSTLIHTFELSKLPVNRIELVSRPGNHETNLPENEFETAGKVVAAACEDGRVVLLDLGTKQTIAEFGAVHGTPVRAVAYDIGQQLVYAGLSDGTVQVWSDSDPSKPMLAFRRNNSPITNVALVRKGSEPLPLVCVATEDGQLYLAAVALSAGKVVGVDVAEELVGFDVDPVNRIRVTMSSQKDATRQTVWAAGRVRDIFEF
ncbi:hypothetical protein FBU59_004143 [Linderina macrospora]|uniref:Uncharacterized protein n=1 Tax=Linderina macrospora TaxID=4868 RepID=A0ACC1J6L5_9FUNG|nr:hypothetical protein FBU59_004143 [Linderina macrospora]